MYSRALELNKSLVGGWLGQVQMLVLLGEPRQAEMWSRTGLELFPNNAGLLAARGQAFCRLSSLKQAHECCDGALQQNGKLAYAWMVRGELMVSCRQKVDEHCFDNAQQLDPDWLVPLEIALVYLHYRVPSKAMARARRAVELAPDCYYAWYLQGLCQEQLGFGAQARQSYQRCLELSPHHHDAQERLRELGQSPQFLSWFFRLFGKS
jgi:tetratricopeptide (TPR) repeat protein